MKMKTILILLLIINISFAQTMNEQHRPQIHFSPKANWINDPNGMVYHNGTYHLFFQYYPSGTTWGPMHWGHATSPDMIHWKEQPIAIYPDSLGYIFSGSAVVDKNNTSGLGEKGNEPLVAIYTSHNPSAQKEKRVDFETQSLSYSNDDGNTWKKYGENPVLKNPGITDFRDPKVMWYEPQKKWVMTLATKDRIAFYASPDLKNWKKESEFGKEIGAHGGVWECPDLFSLDDNGKKIWVLIVNLNPGGPNAGSGTQYFVGNFDGTVFTPAHKDTRWLDYGPDNYAGVTWSNTGDRKILLGWMSNWLYANLVPTQKWRNAMTIPRELKLKHVGNDIFVSSSPIAELSGIQSKPVTAQNVLVSKSLDITHVTGKVTIPCRLNLSIPELKDFSVVLSNDRGEEIIMGFDKAQNQYFIDRTRSGKIAFQKEFAARHVAPRLTTGPVLDFTLVIDDSSVEFFVDDGLTVMTSIFFPNKPFTNIHLRSSDSVRIEKLEFMHLNGIWK